MVVFLLYLHCLCFVLFCFVFLLLLLGGNLWLDTHCFFFLFACFLLCYVCCCFLRAEIVSTLVVSFYIHSVLNSV